MDSKRKQTKRPRRTIRLPRLRHDSPSERRADAQAKPAPQRNLFDPVDVQNNLFTGKEKLDPARERTDLETPE